MKKVLIIGGTGFLGSQIINVLNDYEVIIPTRNPSYKNFNKSNLSFIFFIRINDLIKIISKLDLYLIINCSNSYAKSKNEIKNSLNSNILFPLEILLNQNVKYKYLINLNTILPAYHNLYSLSKNNLIQYLKLFIENDKILDLHLGSVYGYGMSKNSLIYSLCFEKPYPKVLYGNDMRSFLYISDFISAFKLIIGNINKYIIFDSITLRNKSLIKLSDLTITINELLERRSTFENNNDYSEPKYLKNTFQDISGWNESFSLIDGIIDLKSKYNK